MLDADDEVAACVCLPALFGFCDMYAHSAQSRLTHCNTFSTYRLDNTKCCRFCRGKANVKGRRKEEAGCRS